MSSGIGAVIAAKKRRERDAADPAGAALRNRRRALATLIVAAIWGGAALIVVATVAPAAFRVLPTRALAGALVGQVLPVVFGTGFVAGMLALVLAPRGAPRVMLRRIGAVGTLAGCIVAQGVIAPRIEALRVQIGPSVEALAATDPLRVSFGRLHALSVLSLGVAMVFALVTLVGAALAVQSTLDGE